jgi:hypothetical protein
VRDAMLTQVNQALGRLESELGELTPPSAGSSDWATTIGGRVEEAFADLRNSLMVFAGERARQISREYLNVTDDLEEIVSKALDGPPSYASEPLPLLAVIEQLEDLVRHLDDVGVSETKAIVASRSPYQPLEEAHRTFRDWRDGQIDAAQLKPWWPMLSLLIAAAWTPVLMDAFDNMAPPDPGSTSLWRPIYSALSFLSTPWLLALVLLALAWLIGGLFFQSAIERWQHRALSFFVHPNQGVLVDRVRELIRASALRASLDQFVDETYLGLVRQVSSELRAAILAVRERLEQRQREAMWLRLQMREFLRTHGIDAVAEDPGKQAFNRSSAYSTSVESERDLQTVLARNPPTPERFTSMQAEIRPFARWKQKYCDDFLHPIRFLEQLSRHYDLEPTKEAGLSAYADKSKEKGLGEFLAHVAAFHVGFRWGSEPGAVVGTESFCVLPEQWRSLPAVQAGLSANAFPESRIMSGISNDRLHLLRIDQGVSPSRVLEAGPMYIPSQEAERS